MNKEFIVKRQGKDFVLYAGLIDQAHREGLKSIVTTLLQAPSDANGHTAICHAVVTTSKGSFCGIGDANPGNVGRQIAMHAIRMAETRAKARALRDAINVGVTALEELGSEADDDPPQQQHPVVAARKAAKAAAGPPRGPITAPSPNRPATQEQYNKMIELCNLLHSKFGYTFPMADSYTQLSAQIAITELKAKGRELAAAAAEPTALAAR